MTTLTKIPPLPNGATYCTRDDGTRQCTGSQMGRRNMLPDDLAEPVKLRMVRLRFIDGCYDQGGAYWGSPANLYRALGESEASDCRVELFVRGNTRDEAKAGVRSVLPNARFHR